MNFSASRHTYYTLIIYVFIVSITACQSTTTTPSTEKEQIHYCLSAPQIDGIVDEQWSVAEWKPLNQLWVGEQPSTKDFQGQYKVMWNEDGLYVMANIVDDVLIDTNRNPLKRYWDDDCLEIFVDEDASKGNHQFSHNAFAYHIAIDQRVADIGSDKKPHLYPDNVKSIMKDLGGNEYLWEVKLNMYSDDFKEGAINQPIKLKANQDFGFAIAYCDNDTSDEREHFMGNKAIEGKDKNRGWIDAGVFGQYVLVKK